MSLNKLPAWAVLLFVLLSGMWWLSAFQYTMKWDIMDITLPWQYFISESINAGELPLWNPYVKNGFPQMGLPDTWYPITWGISLIFGMDVWSIQLSYLLHLLIAGVGMQRYLKGKGFDIQISIALGVCYMFSGFMIGNAQHLGWIVGAAWLPWVLYYFDRVVAGDKRGDYIRLAIVGAMLFYGAYLPITIIVAYILVGKLILQLWKKPSTRTRVFELTKALAICLLLSIVGLAGLLDLVPNLNRGEALPLSSEGWGVLTGYFPMEGLSSLLIPYAGGAIKGSWGSDISLINVYFGLMPLVLSISAIVFRSKQGIKYFAIGAVFLMIAMAEVFPFRSWLYYLPLWDKFRFPSLFRLFFIFYLLVSSAYGYQALRARKLEHRISLQKRIIFTSLICLIGLLIYSLSQASTGNFQLLFSNGMFEFNKHGSFHDRAVINLLVHTVIFGILSLGLVLKKDVMKLIPYLIVLEVLIISQFNISETVVHNADPSVGNTEINNYDNKAIQIDLAKPMNTFVDGYWKDELSWFRFNQACITKTPSTSGSSPFSLLTHKAAIANNETSINENPLFLLGEIVDGSFTGNGNPGEISVLSASNNRIELKVNCKEETNLIFLQNFYEGWKVKVDGRERLIQRVNTAFMSAPLSKGDHQVEFYFRPMKMIFAYYLSLISFLCVSGGITYLILKSRKAL